MTVLYMGVMVLDAQMEGRANTSLFLLQHGAHVNSPDSFGITPLAAAARYGHASVVRRCIENLPRRIIERVCHSLPFGGTSKRQIMTHVCVAGRAALAMGCRGRCL